MIRIATSELVQVFRNRAVLLSSLIMPIAAAVFFIRFRDAFAQLGSLGYVAAILVFTVAAFSLYSTAVITLAARRQDLFLKRMRSTAVSDASILTGVVAPITMIALVQVSVLLVVFGAVGGSASDLPLLLVAVVCAFVMMLAFGVATAGVTTSPEHAQVTALPLSLGVVVITSWIGLTGTESLTWVKRLLPGGATAELVMNAWNGAGPLADSLVLVAITLAWVLLAVLAATRMFRWEPRR